jgi:pyruvate dehydrogenase complex dehydrogenase (E1) component
LYFPYDTIIEAFRKVRIDAHFDEGTPDTEVAAKIRAWEARSELQHRNAAHALSQLNHQQISDFMAALRRTVTRRIELVRILHLHGTSRELPSLQAAIEFVQAYNDVRYEGSFARHEIEIRYNNGDLIVGKFADKQNAVDFLRTYQRNP